MGLLVLLCSLLSPVLRNGQARSTKAARELNTRALPARAQGPGLLLCVRLLLSLPQNCSDDRLKCGALGFPLPWFPLCELERVPHLFPQIQPELSDGREKENKRSVRGWQVSTFRT